MDRFAMKLFLSRFTTSTQLEILLPRALRRSDFSPRLKTVTQAVTYLIAGFLPTMITGSLDSNPIHYDDEALRIKSLENNEGQDEGEHRQVIDR